MDSVVREASSPAKSRVTFAQGIGVFVGYLSSTFQDRASPSLRVATQLSTVRPQLGRGHVGALITNHSAKKFTVCYLSGLQHFLSLLSYVSLGNLIVFSLSF